MKYPDWWTQGATVIAADGTKGTLAKLPDGHWRVDHAGTNNYTFDPHPDHWHQEPILCLSDYQIRRVVFEADRAFLRAIGRGGLPEWDSMPENWRAGQVNPRPAPLDTDGLAGVRERVAHAVRSALSDYVR